MPKLAPTYTYAATIYRWVDGDTVWLDVDLGFRMAARTDFRLYGIDTPERGAEGYAEATSRCNALAPAGTPVVIHTVKSPDKYGRWLVDVHTAAGSINEALIAEGLAKAYYGGTKS